MITAPQNAATNTISSDLQRQAVLKEAVREFALRLAPLKAFTTIIQDVPLEGTNEVAIPFYPLTTTASSTFNAATGYTFDQATSISSKKITVGTHKYQPLDFSSTELARQPFLNTAELVKQAAAKLAADVLTDIFSVITAANFGAAALTRPAAAITSDDLADLAGSCDAANWPVGNRSLIMGAGYDTQLKKDPSVKLALNINGTEIVRQGVVPNIAGFNYRHMPNLPANAENLGGIAVASSAIGVVFAPIAPAESVRQQLAKFETVEDPETGITLNYQCFGEPKMGREYHVIETVYGAGILNPAALKRICFA